MIINHNFSSLSSFNQMKKNGFSLQKAMKSLTTGLRINSASDDAAGLAISERLRAQLRGVDQAIENTQDGISLLQTAEGGLEAVTSILQRMRELSVQASNDVLTHQDRSQIQTEVDQLKKEIKRITNTTKFNKKRLLNGETSVLWSSDDENLRARVNGGLADKDQYGQDRSIEGNYRFEISSKAGKAQVQKTNMFPVEYESTGYKSMPEININTGVDASGSASGKGWEFANGVLTITENGTYSITGELEGDQLVPTSNYIIVSPGVKANVFLRDVYITASGYAFNMRGAEVNLYIDPGKYNNENVLMAGDNSGHCSAIEAPAGSKLTISSKNGDYSTDGILRVIGGIHGAGIGGSCSGIAEGGDITINGGTIDAQGGPCAAGIGGGWYGHGGNITINGGNITARGGEGGAGIGAGGYPHVTTEQANGGTITINGGEISVHGGNGKTGGSGIYSYSSVGEGAAIGGGGGFASGTILIDNNADITITGGYLSDGTTSIGCGQYGTTNNITYDDLSVPDAREVPELTEIETFDKKRYTLSEMEQFRTSEGVSLFDDPQRITITQGNGNTAYFDLHPEDTIYDVAERINHAISSGLGQGKYTNDIPKHFCTVAQGNSQTSEGAADQERLLENSTIVIRSVIPGEEGELHFSGNDDVIKALGLNTIQESSESDHNVSVSDAHSGDYLFHDEKVTGNVIHGAITSGIDVEFDSMAGIAVSWDDVNKEYKYESVGTKSSVLHMSDNATKVQTGSNEGEDVILTLADVSAETLGIDRVDVTTRETASRAITIIDSAMDKVLT